MDLLQNATDNQIAVIGCLVALGGSFGLLSLSFFFGPRSSRQEEIPIAGKITTATETTAEQAERKAA
ncbi:MAG: hypothetical protein CMJ78_24360 [Planctomycetaceae bacterium]|nr:hypothetical protein [Planctomycetaceae bacterium]